MVAASIEIPLFINTSIGTHIAISISPHITVGDLKRKLRMEHYLCFPHLGKVRVNSLKVKRKSCFYHLPDSMHMLNAFQGLKGSWFLHMDATCLEGKAENMEEDGKSPAEVEQHISAADTPSVSPYCENAFIRSGTLERLGNLIHLSPLQDKSNERLGLRGSVPWKPLDCNKRHQPVCHKDLVEEPLTLVRSHRKRRRMRKDEQNDPQESVTGTAKDTKLELVSSTETMTAETITNFDLVEDKRTEFDIAQIESLDIDPKDTNLSSEFSLLSEKHQLERTHQSITADSAFPLTAPTGNIRDRKDDTIGVLQKKLNRKKLHNKSFNCMFTFTRETKDEPPCKHCRYGIQENFRNIDNKVACEKGNATSRTITKSPCESSSEIISVTGILTRYFSDFDEVSTFDSSGKRKKDECSKKSIDKSLHVTKNKNSRRHKKKIKDGCKTLIPSARCGSLQSHRYQSVETEAIYRSRMSTTDTPLETHFPPLLSPPLSSSRNDATQGCKLGKHEIGKRLVIASNELGISMNKRTPIISIYRSSWGKQIVGNSPSIARHIDFEVEDVDD